MSLGHGSRIPYGENQIANHCDCWDHISFDELLGFGTGTDFGKMVGDDSQEWQSGGNDTWLMMSMVTNTEV